MKTLTTQRLLTLLLSTLGVAQVQADSWIGATGSYSESSNWALGIVPGGGDDALVDNGGTVLVNDAWSLAEIQLGSQAGTPGGTVNQTAGDVSLGGWLRLAVSANTTGTYTMSGGSITSDGRILIGESGTASMTINDGTCSSRTRVAIGANGGSSGTLSISNGFFLVGSAGGEGIDVGDAGTATLNLAGGVFTNNGSWLMVGSDNSGVGHVNISGGTFMSKCATLVGYRGIGTLDMTGGSLLMGGATANGALGIGNRQVANSGKNLGTVNQSGGTVDVTELLVGRGTTGDRSESGVYNLSGDGVVNSTFWFGIGTEGGHGRMEMTGGTVTSSNKFTIGHRTGAVGVLNQSGGILTHNFGTNTSNANAILGCWVDPDAPSTATWTLSGTAQATVPVLEVAQGQAIATLNLNGGSLAVNQVISTKTTGTATFNFNGGTLQARMTTNAFLEGLSAANVLANGAKIDTAGYDIGISQNLTGGEGNGGLTKIGAGWLTLSGVNSYTGPTTVQGGTLQLDTACLSSNAAVRVAGGTVLNLNFVGNNVVGAFLVDGVDQGTGVFGSSTHPGLIAGTGCLQVGQAQPVTTLTNLTVSNGTNFQFSVTGSGTRIIQTSTNLSVGNAWVPVSTNSAPFDFIDTNAMKLYPQRFYRVVAP